MQPTRRTLLAAGAACLAYPFASGLARAAGASTSAPTSTPTLENLVRIYGTTDKKLVDPLIAAFQARYPGTRVDYQDLGSGEVDSRLREETAAGRDSADVVWSSAMDLQVRLVNDGYARPLDGALLDKAANWTHWKNALVGTTLEPIGFVYNQALLPKGAVAQSHMALVSVLSRFYDQYRNRIACYDVDASGTGLFLQVQDAERNPAFWSVANTMGRCGVKLFKSAGAMLDSVAKGESLLAYNVPGPYAMARAKDDPRLAFVLPNDYALVMSRLAFIPRQSRRPRAAQVWLSFLLDDAGQRALMSAGLPGIRAQDGALVELLQHLPNGTMRPIPAGPGLLSHLNPARKVEFSRQYREALGVTA